MILHGKIFGRDCPKAEDIVEKIASILLSFPFLNFFSSSLSEPILLAFARNQFPCFADKW